MVDFFCDDARPPGLVHTRAMVQSMVVGSLVFCGLVVSVICNPVVVDHGVAELVYVPSSEQSTCSRHVAFPLAGWFGCCCILLMFVVQFFCSGFFRGKR